MADVDIVEFLTARYDEEAASARRAAAVARGAEWASDIESAPGSCFLGSEGVRSFAQVGVSFGAHSIAEHIAVHDPARVLADIAAKRRILVEHRIDGSVRDPETDSKIRLCHSCGEPDYGTWRLHLKALRDEDGFISLYPCATLRLFAAPHAEHEDYDEAWRIDG